MKTCPSLRRLLRLFLALMPVFWLSACFEESIVVKVGKDGSGVVHYRKYSNDTAGAGFLGGLGGGDDEETKPEEAGDAEDETLKAELEARAASMGEGVVVQSFRKGKNTSGWDGHEAVFAFPDINKLRLDMNDAMGDGGAKDEEEAAADEPEYIEFEMKDGLLAIRTPSLQKEKEEAGGDQGGAENEAVDPFGDEAGNDPQMAMLAGMAGMFAGARTGYFVEIDGAIAETNALHRKDNLITILRMDLGKIIANAESMKQLERLDKVDAAEAQKIADQVDGFDADLQQPIKVRFE